MLGKALPVKRHRGLGMRHECPQPLPLAFADRLRVVILRLPKQAVVAQIGAALPARPQGADGGADQKGVDIHGTSLSSPVKQGSSPGWPAGSSRRWRRQWTAITRKPP